MSGVEGGGGGEEGEVVVDTVGVAFAGGGAVATGAFGGGREGGERGEQCE